MLERSLGAGAVFSIAAGAMISSGLFVLPGLAYAGTGPSVVAAYALAALLYVPTLLAQIELATAMPKAGGNYFTIERSLGSFAGTLAGMINWLSISLKAAFALVGLGTLAEWIYPEAGALGVKGVAVGACVLFAVLNAVSVKGAGHAQSGLVVALLAVLGIYIAFGLPAMEQDRFMPFTTGDTAGFFTVTGMIFVSYGGVNAVVDVAEEVRDPGRNLPLGMVAAFGVVNAVYVLAVAATVGLLPADQLAGNLTPIADGAKVVLGLGGAVAVTAAAFCAYATTGNAGILSASRSPMAMSRDGLVPGFLSNVHPRFGTPITSIALTAAIILGTVTLLSVKSLVETASIMLLLSFILANAAVLIMRKSGIPGYRPSFRAPLWPVPQVAAIVVYVLLILDMDRTPLLVCGGFLAAGALWYLTYVHWRITRESAVVYMVKTVLWNHFKRTGLEDELRQIALEREGIETDRLDHLIHECPVLDIEERIPATELFRRLAKELAPTLPLDEAGVYDAFLAREQESSTVIQPGLAIPHILVEGAKVFSVALVRCKGGVVFSEIQPPVHTAFVMIGSADERNFHLKALVAFAHVVQDPRFETHWRAARNPEQLRDVIILARRDRVASPPPAPASCPAPAAPASPSAEDSKAEDSKEEDPRVEALPADTLSAPADADEGRTGRDADAEGAASEADPDSPSPASPSPPPTSSPSP